MWKLQLPVLHEGMNVELGTRESTNRAASGGPPEAEAESRRDVPHA